MQHITLLLIFVGLLFGQFESFGDAASAEKAKWFWAWIPAEHKIVAYASDGTANELLTADYGFNLKRVDDQTAVLVVHQEDNSG